MAVPDTSAWRPNEILRFVRSLESSANTVVVQTDAGLGYLKAMGNAAGEHCLACEWVATHLARWFKLQTFDYALVAVTDLDEIPFHGQGHARPGPAFITRAEVGEPWSSTSRQLNYLVNPRDISRLVVFDTWVLNCDRHAPNNQRQPNYNNVFLSTEAPAGSLMLKAMDHTHAFTCGRDLTPRIAPLDRIRDQNVYGLFPGFRPKMDQDAFQQALADLGSLPRQLVEAIVGSIPRQWDVTENARKALVDLVFRRALWLARDRLGIMGMFLSQGHLNLPGEREDKP